MEDQVLELLRATQLSAAQPRMAAELQLKQLHGSEPFPVALVTIGAHADIPVADRLAALVTLRHFVNTAWSPALEDFAGKVLVGDEAKAGIRRTLLSITYGVQGGSDSKVVASTAAVVAAIAGSDFPEEWPDLLDSILNQIPQSTDDQTQAILVVLGELVDGGLDEDAFYRYAQRIFDCLRGIVVDGGKRLMVRAHAVNIFRSGLDFLENLKLKEDSGIRAFADGIRQTWFQFFLEVVREALPAFPTPEQEEALSNPEIAVNWRGVVALKIQVVLVGIVLEVWRLLGKLTRTGSRANTRHLSRHDARRGLFHGLLGLDTGPRRAVLRILCRGRAARRLDQPVSAILHARLPRD